MATTYAVFVSAILMCFSRLPVSSAQTFSSTATPFILLPNVLRLETDEVITVTSLETEHDVTFQVYLQDYPDRKRTFSQKNITVPVEQVSNVTVRVTVEDLDGIEHKPPMVFLVVESVDLPNQFVKDMPIMVNESPGHIFIQTDKPLYTPHQTVHTRVIALDDSFKPTEWPVQIEIQNPDGLTISREVMEGQDGMRNDVMRIPDNPVYGNWTVTAVYTNGLKTKSQVRFEVKEYVLPTFAVTFDIPEENKVVLPNHTSFSMDIQATYTYGKPVHGHVTVTYGLMFHGHTFSIGVKRGLKLDTNGKTQFSTTMDELKTPLANIWFPNGGKLHFQAAVTEQASGRIEKATDVSVVFSKRLHIVKFTKSSRYFKPGLSYILEVEAYKADGAFGRKLPLVVECKAEVNTRETEALTSKFYPTQTTFDTDERGKLNLEFSVPWKAKTMTFMVRPASAVEEEESDALFYFQARPFFSPSNVYMQIQAELTSKALQGKVPEVGDMLGVTTRYTAPEYITTISLVVLSRGHIVWQARTYNLLGHSTSFHFNITQNMSPGMRVLAFSVHGNTSEVISDSVWVEVQGRCDGKEVTIQREEDSHFLRPRDFGTLKVKGQPNAKVGLLAVDAAVLLLRNSTFTREKMFEVMLSRDRGCGIGSGKDSVNVFQNAGLSVITNAGLKMEPKLAKGCLDKTVKRKRRSATSDLRLKAKKKVMDICCLKGARVENATVTFCHQVSLKLLDASKSKICSKEFFFCCKERVNRKLDIRARLRSLSMEEREATIVEDQEAKASVINFDGGDTDGVDVADIPLRSNFPESWWFNEYKLGPTGEQDIDFTLPDSITTWSISAVSVSKEAGICIAPPLTLKTFSSFFVHVDLPYSVVRLEQIEVRVTVYNYMSRRLRVRLVLQSKDGICYAGEPGKNTEMIKLDVDPQDASSTFFPIVPLEMGEFPIRVIAFSSWGRDAVEKTLRVEGEGIEKIHTVSVMLDPSGKRLYRTQSVNKTFSLKNEVRVAEKRQKVELDLDLPHEIVPDTEDCTVHAMGDLLGPTIHVIIEGVASLLRLPTGCGEQNLIYLAPNVYVTRYLMSTRKVSPMLKKKAVTLIREGVNRQMNFRKDDGSFGTWRHAESSTWLTAFAMKTLCQSEEYSPLDHNQTCQSFEWVGSKQKADGSFIEDAWVTHREMLGGISGDVSHTAFVLASLLECRCPGQVNSDVISKAINYVEIQAFKSDRPLAVAISAYALTLAGSRASDALVSRLAGMARSSPEGYTYWGPGKDSTHHTTTDHTPHWYTKKPGALAVEITAYALLTYLARGDVTTGTNIVGWLLQQRNSHGAFVSTQDTVIGLQALSEYSIKSYSSVLDMMCHVRSEVDERFRKSISLTPEDAMVVKSIPKVPTGGKLHFEAEGTGVGLMQVEVRFNVPEEQEECMFELDIHTQFYHTLLQKFFGGKTSSKCEPCVMDCEEEEKEEEEDYEDFTFPPIIPRILWSRRNMNNVTFNLDKEYDEQKNKISPVDGQINFSKIGRPSHRSRRSLDISHSAMVICIKVCVRFKGNKTTGMSVIDVGLFTGFSLIEDDLKTLVKSGKIEHYEQSRRSVVFYIDEISSKDTLCLRFRAKQEQMARNIQPAQVQVFDYYNPDDRCTKFYKINNSSGQLVNFCDHQKQICQCLESRCPFCEEKWHGLRWMDMMKYGCQNATYILEVKALDKSSEKAGFERLLGQILVIHSQRGKHKLKPSDKIILLKRSSCYCLKLIPGKTYIFMMSDPRRFKDADGNQIYAFLLDKDVFAMEYIKKMRGLSSEKRAAMKNLRRTTRRLERRGCKRGLSHRSKNKGKGKRRTRRNKRTKNRRRKSKSKSKDKKLKRKRKSSNN